MIVGIGVDIVEVDRVRQAIERQEDRFLNRIFTPAEQEFCRKHHNSFPHYAVRFAAKEALFKALGTGWAKGVTWLDVEVRREGQSAPTLLLSSEAQRLSAAMGTRSVHITLSHTHQFAVAMVILEN
jgi:holo-[acyl-carrier protein] synthase